MLAGLPATYSAENRVRLAKRDAHRIKADIQMMGEAKQQ
jgi:hypothetical protein